MLDGKQAYRYRKTVAITISSPWLPLTTRDVNLKNKMKKQKWHSPCLLPRMIGSERGGGGRGVEDWGGGGGGEAKGSGRSRRGKNSRSKFGRPENSFCRIK